MSEKQILFVTGACGWIGRQVCLRLQQAGHTVIALDRAQESGPWDDFFEIDISRDEGLPDSLSMRRYSQMGNARTVVHCAGHVHRPVETPEEIRTFYEVNSRGTQRVVNWAKSTRIKRIVYLSSIAFYEWGNQPAREDHSTIAETAYAKSKLEGEDIVRSSGLDFRIARLATVFGQGDRANFSKLAKALKTGRFILPGKGQARKSVISIQKASTWLAEYSVMDGPPHALVNLGFRKSPTLWEICMAFHDTCGFKMPISLPVKALKGMALAGDLISRWKPGFPLTTSTLKKLTSSTSVDCRKASDMFDNDCDFQASLRASASYYKEL